MCRNHRADSSQTEKPTCILPISTYGREYSLTYISGRKEIKVEHMDVGKKRTSLGSNVPRKSNSCFAATVVDALKILEQLTRYAYMHPNCVFYLERMSKSELKNY